MERYFCYVLIYYILLCYMTHRRIQCPMSSQEHNGQWSACPRAVPPPSCSRPLKTPCGKQGLCGRPSAPPPVKSVSRRAISGPSATSSSTRLSLSIQSSQTVWSHTAHFCAQTHKSAPTKVPPRILSRSPAVRTTQAQPQDTPKAIKRWAASQRYAVSSFLARLARQAGWGAPRLT